MYNPRWFGFSLGWYLQPLPCTLPPSPHLPSDHCGYRQFSGPSNSSELFADGYSVEVYFHEVLAISPHRCAGGRVVGSGEWGGRWGVTFMTS